MDMISINLKVTSSNTFDVILSKQAILICAAVHGAFKLNEVVIPYSRLAALIASLIANKEADAKNNGGSPTAYKRP